MFRKACCLNQVWMERFMIPSYLKIQFLSFNYDSFAVTILCLTRKLVSSCFFMNGLRHGLLPCSAIYSRPLFSKYHASNSDSSVACFFIVLFLCLLSNLLKIIFRHFKLISVSIHSFLNISRIVFRPFEWKLRKFLMLITWMLNIPKRRYKKISITTETHIKLYLYFKTYELA